MNKAFLNAPFPRIQRLKNASWVIVAVGLFTSSFFLIFKPFGIVNETGEWFVDLIIAGFGFIFIATMFFMEWVIPKLFPRLFERWTLKKAVIWYAILILIVALNNYIYKGFWNNFQGLSLSGYLIVLGRTISLTFVVFFSFVGITRYLSKNGLINLTNSKNQLIKGNGNESLACKLQDILFIESDNNYVDIHLCQNAKRTKVVLRSSLKNIEKQLIHPLSPLMKCHRRYLINPFQFEIVNNKSREVILSLKEYDDLVPVSKAFEKGIKKEVVVRPKNLSILHKTA